MFQITCSDRESAKMLPLAGHGRQVMGWVWGNQVGAGSEMRCAGLPGNATGSLGKSPSVCLATTPECLILKDALSLGGRSLAENAGRRGSPPVRSSCSVTAFCSCMVLIPVRCKAGGIA